MKISPKKKSLIITDSRMRCKNKWICKTIFAEELLFWVGSVGKTQLTRVWCCQHRAGPGGILRDCDWVDLQGAQDPKADLMYQRWRTLNLICSLQQFHFRGFDYSHGAPVSSMAHRNVCRGRNWKPVLCETYSEGSNMREPGISQSEHCSVRLCLPASWRV